MADERRDPNPHALDAFYAAARRAMPKVAFTNTYGVRCIGNTRDASKKIAVYVAAREKVGTFPLPWHYEKTKQPPPKSGDFTILVDYDGEPYAVVRTSSIQTVRFADVSDHHTEIDGPPVRKVAAWRPVHIAHWTRQLAPHGLSITDDMPVWIERFDLIYAPTAPYYLPVGPAQPKPAEIEAFVRAAGHSGDAHVRWIGLDAPTTDQIIDLIKARDKTGTFTLPWILARTDNRLPKAGDALVLVDFAGQPALAVRLTKVYETAFGKITAADTAIDGTPVRDLAVWKPMHTQYWTALLKPFGLSVSDDMPVLIEAFELIHAR
ncbi:MAG: ASCH domain-containing protein [Alphaproteobacteria bacterium]|nr:ASCH domain-containing protein [Alphaproteobacteria bacterium]